MEQSVGIDVSLALLSVCGMDRRDDIDQRIPETHDMGGSVDHVLLLNTCSVQVCRVLWV